MPQSPIGFNALNAMLKAACLGGVITALTVLAKFALVGSQARFFDGLSASLTSGPAPALGLAEPDPRTTL